MMRKIVSFMHMSLDGFVGDSNGGLGWVPYNEEFENYAEEVVGTVGAPVYGRVTYRMMESYWPTVLEEPAPTRHALEHATWINDVHKIVISRSMDKVEWNNTQLIKDNIVEEMTALKEQPGKDLVIFGSPSVTKELMRLGLVDEFRLSICPVILGAGISMFDGDGGMTRLKLLSSRTLQSGIIAVHYAVEK